MPRLLDLFCGAGGAAMGYARAGFEVVGVDHLPQKHYPFTFVQADALTFPLDGFDAIHASPPCQGYSRLRHLPWLAGKSYPLLLPFMEARLRDSDVPWVIENVEDAPLDASCVLCGRMFGLPLYRHRRFSSSHLLLAPYHPRHASVIKTGRLLGNRYRGGVVGVTAGVPRSYGTLVRAVDGPMPTPREAMGIDWMSTKELTQAIPPVYTEWIGRQLLAVLANTQAA